VSNISTREISNEEPMEYQIELEHDAWLHELHRRDYVMKGRSEDYRDNDADFQINFGYSYMHMLNLVLFRAYDQEEDRD